MTKKTTQPKKRTKLQEAEFQTMILTDAIYMAYDDSDEAQGVLSLVINELEKPIDEINHYHLRRALKGLRSLLISHQHLMMDCAGLEY
jgi:hypothetical protein